MTDYRMISGLGNPGRRYANTRHNFGFMVIDALHRKLFGLGRVGEWRSQTGAEFAEANWENEKLWLYKPMQYMNRSGQPISNWARYRNVPVDSLIVVHDDLDLAFGKVRIKRGGGNGGHNGLRSVSGSLQSDDYTRVRIGIGRPVDAEFRIEIADWVLSAFSDVEREELDSVIERGVNAIVCLLEKGLLAAQNLYN